MLIKFYSVLFLILAKITLNLSRIITGTETIPHQYPFQVIVINTDDNFCSGSIISDEWVLTAAHCVDFYKDQSVMVYYGVHVQVEHFEPIYLSSHRIEKEDIYIHPNYTYNDKDDTSYNDLALLHLPEKIEFKDKIGYINLPSRSDINNNFTGEEVTITGWGETETEPFSHKLLHVKAPVISNSKCQNSYGVRDTIICTFLSNNAGCHGDSGGPLIYESGGKQILIGVTSSGNCYYVTIFSRVTSFLNWISETTGIKIKN